MGGEGREGGGGGVKGGGVGVSFGGKGGPLKVGDIGELDDAVEYSSMFWTSSVSCGGGGGGTIICFAGSGGGAADDSGVFLTELVRCGGVGGANIPGSSGSGGGSTDGSGVRLTEPVRCGGVGGGVISVSSCSLSDSGGGVVAGFLTEPVRCGGGGGGVASPTTSVGSLDGCVSATLVWYGGGGTTLVSPSDEPVTNLASFAVNTGDATVGNEVWSDAKFNWVGHVMVSVVLSGWSLVTGVPEGAGMGSSSSSKITSSFGRMMFRL